MMTLGLKQFKGNLKQIIIYFFLSYETFYLLNVLFVQSVLTWFFFFTIHQRLVTVYNFEGFPCLTNQDATSIMMTDKGNNYMKVHDNECITEIDMQYTTGTCSF